MRDADAAILAEELRHVVDDLQDLVGRPLRDVWVPTPTSVVLDVGRRILIESWPVPRFHPITRRSPAPATPFSFQGLLRARLGGRLDAIEQLGGDRVVELRFGALALHARLFGRGGGIWLVEGDRVLAASTGPAPDALPPLALRATSSPTPSRFTPAHGERWADAAARFFGERAAQREVDALRRRLTTHLARLADREARLVAHLRQDLSAAERADAVRHEADCLASSLHLVPRGASVVELPDVRDPDRTVTVRLDPSRPGGWNIDRLYERAKRLARGADQVLVRLETAEARARDLADARAETETCGIEALRRVAATWALPPESVPGTTGAAKPWATWRGPDGEVAWVGRTDVANHALVFRHARARDWWVHVRDRPGAHVVLPTRQASAPSLDLLLAAAQLALHAARVPAGERLDVQYARVADLRPIKGAGPGRVSVRDERVLHVVSDPSRLKDWTRDDDPPPR